MMQPMTGVDKISRAHQYGFPLRNTWNRKNAWMKAVSAIRRGMKRSPELLLRCVPIKNSVDTTKRKEHAHRFAVTRRAEVCLPDVKREALLQHKRLTASLLNEQAQVIAAQRQRERIGEIVGEPWPQTLRLRRRKTLCQRHVKSELIEHER